MKPSPLRLETSFPAKVSIKNHIDGDSEAEILPECAPEFLQNKANPRLWQVKLNVKFAGKPGTRALHEGEIEFVGLFTVTDEVPVESMARLVAVTCPSILYSSAREVVALITGRGPYKAFLLPTVSFTDGTIELDPESEPIKRRVPEAAMRRIAAGSKSK